MDIVRYKETLLDMTYNGYYTPTNIPEKAEENEHGHHCLSRSIGILATRIILRIMMSWIKHRSSHVPPAGIISILQGTNAYRDFNLILCSSCSSMS